ncbi:hypothetical protein AgCh_027171 [Apium graveolens]
MAISSLFRSAISPADHVKSDLRLSSVPKAEREFQLEVEAIGNVRHKNLVGLIGYCAEGSQRLLVYEYVDNGNLEQWLHGDVEPISPWQIVRI